ncbi:MAG: 16S rRNA (uracil(1498)-N(3))-methyltransferase [Clostridia bacterium]|nr:16S rRNA (uracil(1498)-N(3))-methyltransferase [Clostridia bacterium]
MPRFFTKDIDGDIIYINGDDAHHITKSLRMRIGEQITVCNGEGIECLCSISDLSSDCVALDVIERRPSESEPPCRVTLYQGCPKGDKLEFIVEKAVELGVSEIVPVVTARSVSRPDGASAAKKAERLQRRALEAAKQCGRGIIPKVGDFITFEQMLNRLQSHETSIFFYELGGKPLSHILSNGAKDVALIIGPEGGFEPEEAQAAVENGAKIATMGKRILRTETAAVASAAAVMLLTGGMD